MGGFVSNLFGSGRDVNITPEKNRFEAIDPTTGLPQQDYANPNYAAMQGVQDAAAASNQSRGQQRQLSGMLMDQALGKGPSVAQNQLTAGLDQNRNAAASAIASQRGANPAMAAGLLLNQQAGMNQQAVGQAANLRAQEMLAAREQLGGVLGQQRGQDLGLMGQQIGMTGTTGQLQQGQNQLASQNNLTTQQMNQQTAEANAQRAQQASLEQERMRNQNYGAAAKTQGDVAGGLISAGGAALGMSEGGEIDSPVNDTVPAMLSPGEHVLPVSVTQSPHAPEMAYAFEKALQKSKRASDIMEYGEVLRAKNMADGGPVAAALNTGANTIPAADWESLSATPPPPATVRQRAGSAMQAFGSAVAGQPSPAAQQPSPADAALHARLKLLAAKRQAMLSAVGSTGANTIPAEQWQSFAEGGEAEKPFDLGELAGAAAMNPLVGAQNYIFDKTAGKWLRKNVSGPALDYVGEHVGPTAEYLTRLGAKGFGAGSEQLEKFGQSDKGRKAVEDVRDMYRGPGSDINIPGTGGNVGDAQAAMLAGIAENAPVSFALAGAPEAAAGLAKAGRAVAGKAGGMAESIAAKFLQGKGYTVGKALPPPALADTHPSIKPGAYSDAGPNIAEMPEGERGAYVDKLAEYLRSKMPTSRSGEDFLARAHGTDTHIPESTFIDRSLQSERPSIPTMDPAYVQEIGGVSPKYLEQTRVIPFERSGDMMGRIVKMGPQGAIETQAGILPKGAVEESGNRFDELGLGPLSEADKAALRWLDASRREGGPLAKEVSRQTEEHLKRKSKR